MRAVCLLVWMVGKCNGRQKKQRNNLNVLLTFVMEFNVWTILAVRK